MAVPILSAFPASLTSGDTARINLSFADYPSSGWSAVLKLNKTGEEVKSFTGTANGVGFLFVIATSGMVAGQWTWAVRVTESSSGDSATAQAGDFTLLPDYASGIEKSDAQKQLDGANAALLILVSNPDANASFNGHSYSKENQSALLDIIRELKNIVKQEQAEAAGLRGDAPSRSIRPYFV